MSHEFEVHHLVSQLVALVGAQDRANVDAYVELLLKNRTQYVTAQLQVLCLNCGRGSSLDTLNNGHTYVHQSSNKTLSL